ncbi:MAG TPA: hypothetical protein VF234_08605 [Limnochordia bacterium]
MSLPVSWMAEETKKHQIVALARRDPFLRIGEIAERAGTTPRYVRTILSEAGVSLMALRRYYARAMERRLDDRRPPVQWPPAEWPAGPISVAHSREARWAAVFGTDPAEPLIGVSRVRYHMGRPALVERLLTAEAVQLPPSASAREPLRTLLRDAGDASPSEWSLEIVPAEPPWAEVLGLESGAPLACWIALIGGGRKPQAVEAYLVGAYALRWVWPGGPSPQARWVVKAESMGAAPA